MCVLVVNLKGLMTLHWALSWVSFADHPSIHTVLEDAIVFYILLQVMPQPLNNRKNNCLLSGRLLPRRKHAHQTVVFFSLGRWNTMFFGELFHPVKFNNLPSPQIAEQIIVHDSFMWICFLKPLNFN